VRRFIHHEFDCAYLGSEYIGARRYDCYLEQASPQSLVARYGDEPDECMSQPLERTLEAFKRGGDMPEPFIVAVRLYKSLKTKGLHIVGQGLGRDVTPRADPVGDLVAWSDAVRAAEMAAALLSDVEVVGNERRGALALVCKDTAAARDAYDLLEDRADELHLVAERPTTRWLVYVHYHRP
jgi:hypothetical protein